MIKIHYPGPGKIIRAENEPEKLGSEIGLLGKNLLVLSAPDIFEKYKSYFKKALKESRNFIQEFGGECCGEEISALEKQVRRNKSDVVLVLGGGKAMDAGKMLAARTGIPLAAFPTSSATCACFTHHSVLYTGEGVYLGEEETKNPEILFLDYSLIKDQPFPLFASGLADALAKFYERTGVSGKVEELAVKISELIYLRIHSSAYRPGAGFDRSPKMTDLIEVALLYPGITGAWGGKSLRAGTAHALANAFTSLFPGHPEMKEHYHGELVGLGLLVMLYLRRDMEELTRLRKLFIETDLPVNFFQLGLKELSREELDLIVSKTLISEFFRESQEELSLRNALLDVGFSLKV